MSQPTSNSDLKRTLETSRETNIDDEIPRPPQPNNYLFLTIFSCFCPAYPINIVAFVFSIMMYICPALCCLPSHPTEAMIPRILYHNIENKNVDLHKYGLHNISCQYGQDLQTVLETQGYEDYGGGFRKYCTEKLCTVLRESNDQCSLTKSTRQALNSYNQGDIEGSRRLGRNALWVSVASIIIGLLIIAIYCTVHFTTHIV